MRVMAGALEGDLFIGPKAEVTPMEPAFSWVWGLHSPRSIDSGAELHCRGPGALLWTMCQVSSWALQALALKNSACNEAVVPGGGAQLDHFRPCLWKLQRNELIKK